MGQRSLFLAIGLIIFAIILVAFFVASRLQSGGNKAKSAQNEAVLTTNASAIGVATDPIAYDGKTVEIDSEISDWVTDKAFTVSAGGVGALGGRVNQLLVISNKPFTLPKTTDNEVNIGDNGKVHVKGRVRIMTAKEIENTLGISFDKEARVELDDNVIYGWTKRSVILLDSAEML